MGNQHIRKFRLANKYLRLIIHDKEDGDVHYNEVQEICAATWDRGTHSFKAYMELLCFADAYDIPQMIGSNQPYLINSALHNLIKAAKLVPEGIAQTSIKLISEVRYDDNQMFV